MLALLLLRVPFTIVLLLVDDTQTVFGFTPSRFQRLQRHCSTQSSCRPHDTIRRHAFQPLDSATDWPDKFPAKEHCSKCGLCETSFIKHVKEACAFLEPPATDGSSSHSMDELEERVHGRRRIVYDMVWKDTSKQATNVAEEGRFGVLYEPMKLAKGRQIEDAQWTGLVTGIALGMLESNQVDAVVCIAASDSRWDEPEPIIAKTREQVLRGRGVKPALAPSLKVLDEIQADPTIRRLLFCGVGCAVQAFRSVEQFLDLDEVYVLGTNCADNSPTPNAAANFVRTALGVNSTTGPRGYEFMQDFRVHVKTDGAYITKPYFCLPGTVAEASIAKSCRACFDYTNGLADVVVGYMGAPLSGSQRMDQSLQTLSIRNERGSHMVETAIQAGYVTIDSVTTGSGIHEQLAMATTESDTLVRTMIGGSVPEAGMPAWLGELFALVIRQLGPKGVGFARYSIDYHILRNYLHVVNERGEERARKLMPDYSKCIVDHYLTMPDGKLKSLKDKILALKQR